MGKKRFRLKLGFKWARVLSFWQAEFMKCLIGPHFMGDGKACEEGYFKCVVTKTNKYEADYKCCQNGDTCCRDAAGYGSCCSPGRKLSNICMKSCQKLKLSFIWYPFDTVSIALYYSSSISIWQYLFWKKNCFKASVELIIKTIWSLNQSRICGKGVGLSLFPSDSRSFESHEQFVRKSKKSKDDCFFGHFWAKFGYVSHISAIRI